MLQRLNTNSSVLFSDEYCPHCDNHFVLEALTPQANLHVEGEDARMDSRYFQPLCTILSPHTDCNLYRMLKDERVRADQEKSIFTFRDISDRLG